VAGHLGDADEVLAAAGRQAAAAAVEEQGARRGGGGPQERCVQPVGQGLAQLRVDGHLAHLAVAQPQIGVKTAVRRAAGSLSGRGVGSQRSGSTRCGGWSVRRPGGNRVGGPGRLALLISTSTWPVSSAGGVQDALAGGAHVLAQRHQVDIQDRAGPLADLAGDEDGVDVARVGAEGESADGVVERHVVEVLGAHDEHVGLLAGG
jgi:hypothetical protein